MVTNLSYILVKKVNLFNSIFEKRCLIIKNGVVSSSTYPITDQYLHEYLHGACQTLNSQRKITCKLDPNKAHGHDMISIHMMKIPGDAIIVLLRNIQKLRKM